MFGHPVRKEELVNLKIKNLKTGIVWDINWNTKRAQAEELVSNPNYEVVELSKEEKELMKELEKQKPPTLRELIFGDKK